MLNLKIRRRTFLGLPLSTMVLSLFTGALGLSAKAADNRVWKLNASNYKNGIRDLFALLKRSAKSGGSLPVSSIIPLFPLNPKAPDALERLSKRPNVSFDTARANATGQYDSLDFRDAAIGAVTVIIPTNLSAKYTVVEGEVRFDFEGPDDQLAQLLLWNIPTELSMPKALRLKNIAFRPDGIDVSLSSTVNANTLEMRLSLASTDKINLASANRLSISDAILLVAASSNDPCSNESHDCMSCPSGEIACDTDRGTTCTDSNTCFNTFKGKLCRSN